MFMIHIDHIDNHDGQVWALQVPAAKKYWTLHAIDCRVPVKTRFRKSRQPKAFLYGHGKIAFFFINNRRIARIL